MPELDTKSSHDFWYRYRDPMIYRVVAFMESVEQWNPDGDPELEAAMKDLGDALENVERFELKKEEHFVKLTSSLRMARVLRLMQTIDSADPGSASKLLMYAEEHSKTPEDEAGIFLRRNIVFERLRLLARVFSPYRFELILKAMEND